MNEASVLRAASEIYACNEILLQSTKESVETSYKYVNLQIFARDTRDLIGWIFGRECYNVKDIHKYGVNVASVEIEDCDSSNFLIIII